MTRFEFVLPLISVLAGLTLVDVGTSVHRLLAARDRVRWRWLPLTMAAGIVLALLNFWWALYGEVGAGWIGNYFVAVLQLSGLLLLYLAASLSLPDEVPDDRRLDLLDHYWRQASVLHGVMALYVGGFVMVDATLVEGGPVVSVTQGVRLVIVLLFAAMARSRSRPLHAVGVPLQVAILLGFVVRRTLTL